MFRILLTAFEPFGGETVNPSLEILRVLSSREDVIPLTVPVTFSGAAETVLNHPEIRNCSAVVMLGQAKGRAGITIERVAINIDDASIPDNEGAQPADTPILTDGESASFSTLPVKALVGAIREAGLPASISNTAGTFVCNHQMYRVLDALRDTDIPAGFIHVPALPEQASGADTPSLPLDDMVKAIETVLNTLRILLT